MSNHGTKALQVFTICMALLITSCGEQDVVSIKTENIPDVGWSEDHNLSFDYVKSDGGPLYIRVEHKETYGYENLYVKSTTQNGADTLTSEVFSIPLMTDKGQWIGNLSDGVLSVDHLYPSQPLPDDVTSIQIQQYSRAFILNDIEKVSLLVKKQ